MSSVNVILCKYSYFHRYDLEIYLYVPKPIERKQIIIIILELYNTLVVLTGSCKKNSTNKF